MPPVNDDFASATDLGSAISGEVTFDITNATAETGEHVSADGHTVWFTWTAPDDGTVSFDTADTPAPRWDSWLSAFVGGFGTGDWIEHDDDGLLQPGVTTPDGFGTSQMTFPVTNGTTYYIQADSYDYAADVSNPSAGYPRSNCKLRWSFTATPPPPPPAPTIADVTPSAQLVGRTVVITGTHLDTLDSVIFGTATATYVIDSPTQITATVPMRASGTTVTVSNAGGSDSAAFTPLFAGPWHQPDDRWTPTYERLAGVQSWGTTFTGDYPALPDSSVAPQTVDNPSGVVPWDPSEVQFQEGWVLERHVLTSTTGEWQLRVDEWGVGVDFGHQIANAADQVLPPVVPPLPSNAYDIETESSHGAALGPLQVTIEAANTGVGYDSSADSGPGGIGSVGEPDWSDPALLGARMYAIRIGPDDLTWGVPSSESTRSVLPARWYDPGEFAGSRILDFSLAAVPFTTGPPRTLAVSDNAENRTTIDLTLADLDTDGGYAIALAVSLYTDASFPALPPTVTTAGGEESSEISAGWNISEPASMFAVGNIFYRPPRYRFLYTAPMTPQDFDQIVSTRPQAKLVIPMHIPAEHA